MSQKTASDAQTADSERERAQVEFRILCEKGNLVAAQANHARHEWRHSEINSNGEFWMHGVFAKACCRGDLGVAKWFLATFPQEREEIPIHRRRLMFEVRKANATSVEAWLTEEGLAG